MLLASTNRFLLTNTLEFKCVCKRKAFLILLFLLCYSISVQSQEEKKQTFQSITIEGNNIDEVKPETIIKREQIERLAPQDLGHLLQHTAGVSLRSYGGLGGMKTLSMRGLGGEHTQLVVNGLPTVNAQNGQTDFGLIQMDNIEVVQIDLISRKTSLLPVSAQVMGSTIELATFENRFSPHPISGRASTTIGSFGQYEGFATVKKAKENSFISSGGKYRAVEGSYPYRIQMGSNEIEHNRRNNSFHEYLITLGGGFKINGDTIANRRHVFTFNGQIDGADKELPGAVILYNDLADETLKTQHYIAGGNYTFAGKNLTQRIFAAYNRHFLHYHDPSFLNNDGFIDNQYINNSYHTGVTGSYNVKTVDINYGTDVKVNTMTTNRVDIGAPERFTANSMVGINYDNAYFNFKTALYHQFFEDDNRSLSHKNSYHRFNPHIGIYSGDLLSENFQVYLWHKQSMRPPNFNELYYSQIGTLSLAPEETAQTNLGMTYNKIVRNSFIGIKSNMYYNRVKNKILALPTKNLFVWSIMNVGEVEVMGADLQFNYTLSINKNWKLALNSMFTYQQVHDITDSNSPTYRNQLAYTPLFTGSTTASLYYNYFAWHTTAFHVGERYSLNQNIPANRLHGFNLFDTALEFSLKVKQVHLIRIQGGVRNVFDTSYNFIRFFVMPGRNYFLKLTYELH